MKKTIEDAILADRNVSLALQMLRRHTEAMPPDTGCKETLEAIEADYRLMRECFERGLRDPKGEEMYDSLLRRTHRLYCSVRLESIVRNRQAFATCRNIAAAFAKRDGSVKDALEGFVQEVAMATLLPEAQQRQAVRKAYATHQRYMEELFNHIVAGGPWSDDTAKEYRETLLSPTTDPNDALTITSAVTLALRTVFDANKWTVLADVYAKTTQENLKQRVLVGMMLTLPGKETELYGEIRERLEGVCRSENTRREILEMQMQMVYCTRTKNDTEEIQRDIMPTLIKNNNLKLTRSGVIEEDDSTNDVLDPGATDRNMAELEAKMDKMRNMQKAGSDIFFSGFSRMKRFSFFYQISNWFTPFYPEHPDLTNAMDDGTRKLAENVVESGPFCDSDKYSFALAFATVADKLPKGVKEMIAGGHGGMTASNADRTSPAYIRRMYLHDLYRFYMVYRDRQNFTSPFDDNERKTRDGMLFMANPVLDGLADKECAEAARFLLRLRLYGMVADFVGERNRRGLAGGDEMLMLGSALIRLGRYEEACATFQALPESAKGDEAAMKGMADSLFMTRQYAKAADAYAQLIGKAGSKKQYVLHHSLALINCGKAKEGMDSLFRLDYEGPADSNVKRAIAWGYLTDAKPQEAERIYGQIGDDWSDDDTLNCGYAKWAQGKNSEAAEMFRKYDSAEGNDIADDFKADQGILERNGIKAYEATMMLDIVKG